MRSFVVEPMQHERLFLAGDAAHIVPPTGAKGLNMAMADVWLLAYAIERSTPATSSRLASYSERACERVWRVQHFSWWMTSMLHRFAGDDDFQMQIQLSQLRYTSSSQAQATALAENYVGLPFTRVERGGRLRERHHQQHDRAASPAAGGVEHGAHERRAAGAIR